MIRNIIINILEEKRELAIEELARIIKVHYGVVKKVLEDLRKEGKIEIEKIKNPHKPKKYELIIRLVI